MATKTLTVRDTKLAQWLGEAHAKEAELEADLTAHIALTQKAAYKKRLQAHLKETREHKRAVAKRIKALGGQPSDAPEILGVPTVVSEMTGKTIAAVKGQVGVARALVTEQAETHVRNAQEELREEHVEIAIYTRIEAFADAVGDKDTAQLAKRIRREEERMAKYLTAELPRLVRDVVKAEVPRDERAKPTRTRSAAASKTTAKRRTKSASTSRSKTPARSTASARSKTRRGSTASGRR
jgi:ferritin-like metal-binding protein YciE